MVQGRQVFTFIDMSNGTNQDGERYVAVNVMTKGNKKTKLSFIAKKPELLDKISSMHFIDFQDIILILDFDRIYNKERKTSFWNVELIDIGNNNTKSNN